MHHLVRVGLFALIVAAPSAAFAGGWLDQAPLSAAPDAVLDAVGDATRKDGVSHLLSETVVHANADGTMESRTRRIFAVHNASAIQGWGTVEVSFSPWFESRPEIEARVISPDGSTTTLDPASIQEAGSHERDPLILDDSKRLRAPLPSLVPGAVVEQVIVKRHHAAFSPAGANGVVWIAEPFPVLNVVVQIDAPTGVPLSWTSNVPGLVVKKVKDKGRRGIRVERSGLDAVDPVDKAEPAAPYDGHSLSWSTAPSWAEVASRYERLVEPSFGAEGIEDWVAIVEQAPADERVLRAVELVRDRVRYTGLEFGQQAIRPWTSAESAKRGFGDCKDKAVLLASLLRAVGIDAHLALVRTWPLPDVSEEAPGLFGFNHAIAYLPGQDIWIDATVEHATVGTVPARLQGRKALVIAPGTRGLTPIPVDASARDIEERHFVVPDSGPTLLTERLRATSWADLELRGWVDAQEPDELREAQEKYAEDAWDVAEFGEVRAGDPRDLRTPYVFEVELGGSRNLASYGDGVTLPVSPYAPLDRTPRWVWSEPDTDDPLEDRSDPVVIVAHEGVGITRVQYPPLYTIDREPQPVDIHVGPLRYTLEREDLGEHDVQFTSRMIVAEREVTVEHVKAFREELGRALTEVEQLALVEPGLNLSDTGRFADAIAHYDQAGDSVLARRNRAEVLRRIGLRDASLATIDALLADEPDNADAWGVRSWIVSLDPVDRAEVGPFGRAETLRSLRKANELSGDFRWTSQLLEVLTTGEQGLPASAADLAEARELAEAWRNDDDDPADDATYDALHFKILAGQGRWEEVRNAKRSGNDTVEIAALQLAAIARTEGVDAVRRAANVRVPDARQRSQVIGQAAFQLLFARDYVLGPALIELSAEGQDDGGAKAREFARMLRGARRWEDALDDLSGPGKPVAAVLAHLVIDSDDPTMRQFFTRELDDELFQEVLTGRSAASRAFGALPFPPVLIADIMIGSMTVEHVEGSGRTGYRVDLVSAAGAGMQQRAFVVKEKGEFRIASLGDGSRLLGAEALRRADKRDLAGARQWLDWCTDLASGGGSSDAHGRPPALAFWTRGQDGSLDEARQAAAMYAFDLAADTLRAMEGDADLTPDQQVGLARELLYLEFNAEDPAAALRRAKALVAAHPDVRQYKTAWMDAAIPLHDLEEARDAADALLAEVPDDAATLAALAVVEVRKDPAAGLSRLRDMVRRGMGGAEAANELAWWGALNDMPIDEALATARRGVAGNNPSLSRLHTLATLLIERGDVDEAIAVWHRAGQAASEPLDVHWNHVSGGIALRLGLPDVAAAHFARVDRESTTWPYTERLAKREGIEIPEAPE